MGGEVMEVNTINLEEIIKRIDKMILELAAFTATSYAGVTRLPFSKEAKEAVNYLKDQMEYVGLVTRIDASGAIIGRLEGKNKEAIILGSHYDSVRNGGAYDGIAGIVCGIEVARLLQENHIVPQYSLEVIGTNDEEGARFKSGFFSSKAMLGEWTMEKIKSLKDAEGISIYEAMEAYGLDPNRLEEARRDLEEIKAFIEIHIEQGPVLETHENEVGIVDVIVGMKRYLVTLYGRADHAGTTPMNMRMDAMEAASKMIEPIGNIARKYEGAVATVGHIKALPNEINTIAEKVTFSLDIRCTKEEILNAIEQQIKAHIDEVADTCGMSYGIENTMSVTPVEMNSVLRDKIEASCIAREYDYEHMNSGAGHDSLVLAKAVDTAMIFVPSKKGRSHCKEEFTEGRHLAQAALIALDVIQSM